MAQIDRHTIRIPVSAGIAGLDESRRPRRFVVETRYPTGNVIRETDVDKTELPAVLEDIVNGQHDGIVRVYELRGVSVEIAQAIADASFNEQWPLTRDLQNFLECNCVHVPNVEAA